MIGSLFQSLASKKFTCQVFSITLTVINLFLSPVKQLHKSQWVYDVTVYVIAVVFIIEKSAGLIIYTVTSAFLEPILYAVTT